MKKYITLLLLIPSLIFLSCKEDDPINPSIETADVALVSAAKFTAKGTINNLGDIPIVDYGFVYSANSTNPALFSGTVVSLGKKPSTGSFEKDISLGGYEGYYGHTPTLFIRAYLTNEKGTVYGLVKSFNVPDLSIQAVEPNRAKEGDIIKIIGNYFSSKPEDNIVKFNSTIAVVKSASSTELTVVVPSGISWDYYSEKVSITVSTGSQTAYANHVFSLSPTITDFEPKTGTFGTLVTIYGSNFSGITVYVSIGNESISIDEKQNNFIRFYIPSNVTTGTIKFSLWVNYSEVVEVPGEFTMLPPVINSIAPLKVVGGSLITITGSNFNYYGYYNYNNNIVKIGNVQAILSGASANQIVAYVPESLTPGKSYEVSVFTGVHTAIAADQLTVAIPEITSITPKVINANSYDYITILGSNFGNIAGTVKIGTATAYIQSWSNDTIYIYLHLILRLNLAYTLLL